MKRMDPRERVTRAFSDADSTSDFDRLGEHLWRPIGATTVELSAPQEGERVLDACCGNGASALPAARRVGPDGHVDAVDLSAPLLADLERQADGWENVTAAAADATSWGGDGYDLVQCVLGVFFFPDMTAGTEHLVTRLRPGGRAAITIWRRGSMEAAGRHLGQAITAVTGEELPPRPPHLLDEINTSETFGPWLADRGLRDVEVTESELRLPLSADLAWLVITGSGFAGMLTHLSEDQIERVRQEYLVSLQEAGAAELEATTLIGVGRA
ncbi:class I SAM-dependent methyltransferase [Nesterenkonia suensis]